MKPTTHNTHTVSNLPGRVDSAMLAKFLQEGEPVVVLKLVGVGNSAPYDFRDKGTRSYIFRFDANAEGHLLRIPLHLWQENKARLAHDIMDQRHLAHALIVTLETQAPTTRGTAAAAVDSLPQNTIPLTIPEKTGATDTSTDTRNVVGPGAEPTVAPTSGDAGDAAGEGSLTTADEDLSEPQAAREGATASVGDIAVQAEKPPLVAGKALHEAAYELAEPPKRIKALAALLGVTEPTLREAIGHTDSQVEMAHAGWVRRRG